MYWHIEKYDEQYAIGVDAIMPCLLIPGWSVGSDIFEWLLPGLAQHFVVSCADVKAYPELANKDSFIAELAAAILTPTWIIGWSLGGNIALDLAVQYPDKVLGLCLLSTTPRFIEDENWSVGMAVDVFEKFQQGLAANVTKMLHRFDLLQSKDDKYSDSLRYALGEYRAQQKPLPVEDLQRGLDLLQNYDQRDLIRTIQQPMLWCFGSTDTLVNSDTVEEIRQILPLVNIEVFHQTAHLPFLTATDHFFKALLQLFDKNQLLMEKHKVAKAFSKAAKSYDQSARLQQWVAGRMIEKVNVVDGILLDAGCGTAYWTTQLAEKADTVIGLDMAEGMLQYGKSKYRNISYWLGADLELLPLSDGSVSQIFSSLSVQWCHDMHQLLDEWYRILKPGGKAYIATLGPQTLFELRESWSKVDSYNHVNYFLSSDKICEQVGLSRFTLKELQIEHKVIRYETLMALMKDLKNIGAQTVMHGGIKSLMGKSRFIQAQNAYEEYRDHVGLLPATYEVIFLCLEKQQ